MKKIVLAVDESREEIAKDEHAAKIETVEQGAAQRQSPTSDDRPLDSSLKKMNSAIDRETTEAR